MGSRQHYSQQIDLRNQADYTFADRPREAKTNQWADLIFIPPKKERPYGVVR